MIDPDFDGDVMALADAETGAIPESRRREWSVMRSAVRLYQLRKLDAPAIIIESERRFLLERLSVIPAYGDEFVNTRSDA